MSTTTREDREKAGATVYIWGDFVNKIINLVISRHQLATKIIMVNDHYNLPYSIKDNERDRRKQDNLAIPSVFPKLKDKFPSVSEFNTIYYNIRSTDKDTMVVINATSTYCYVQAAVVSKRIQSSVALKRKDC